MDEPLPERGAEATRLQLLAWLRQGAPVPGVLAARPVLSAGRGKRAGRRRQSGQAEEAHAGAVDSSARPDPGVLLPRRDLRRSPRRDARVRYSRDEPATSAAADRSDAREPAPAERRQRRARRIAG